MTGSRASSQPVQLKDILCGIDDSYTALEAARQAVMLATPETSLRFVCVAWSVGEAPATRMSNIGEERAAHALKQATEIAAEKGIEASSEIIRSSDVTDQLLEQAGDCDLFVIGARGHSRAAGILLGSTATSAAHRASGPILLAKRAINQLTVFPGKILVASDGSPDSAVAVELAAEIARQHDSTVLLLHVEETTIPERGQLSQQIVRLQEVTGREPTVVQEHDHVHETIVRTAEREHVSLIALGSRGLGGARALGSVSERVAHQAKCSVLIARPRDEAKSE